MVKMFNEPRWNLLIQKEDQATILIKSNEHQWFADPFLFEEGEKTFVFVEVMQKWRAKGAIGYFDLSSKKPKCQIVIDEKFHMSFPNVFRNNSGVFMIPETFQDHKVVVYRSDRFPDKWVKSRVLFDNVFYVDTALVEFKNGQFELATYDISTKPATLRIFAFDIENLMVGEQIQALPDNSNELRPAGNSYFSQNDLILPTQGHAGGAERVFLKYQINETGGLIFRSSPETIGPSLGFSACHTINHSQHAVVFDELSNPFDPLRPISGLISRHVWKKRMAVLSSQKGDFDEKHV